MNLLDQLATSMKLNAELLRQKQALEIGGIRIAFSHLLPSNLCRVHVLLGKPESCTESGLRWMLECNSGSMELLPVLALDPETGNAMLCVHLPIDVPYASETLFLFLTGDLGIVSDFWRAGLAAHGMAGEDPARVNPTAIV